MKVTLVAPMVMLCCGFASSSLAQELEPVIVNNWDDDFCRDSGTSVAGLIAGIEVYGPVRGAEAIGETEDLIVSPDGEVLALIAEIGGFLDIGDVHVSVPWGVVEFGEGWARVPIMEANVGDYQLLGGEIEYRATTGGITGGVDDLDPGAGAWRATNLIGDLVDTRDGVSFGRVQDLIISADEAKAIIISPNLGLDLFTEYAIPFQPLAEGEWSPGDQVFQLVYDETEMEDIGAFACD